MRNSSARFICAPWRQPRNSALGSLQAQGRQLRYLQFIRGILAQAEAEEEIPRVGDFGAYGFGLFHLAMMTHWLQDPSPGKEQTLALLDRCLKMATHLLRKGGWDW